MEKLYTTTSYGNHHWDGTLEVVNIKQLEYALLNVDIENISISNELLNNNEIILYNKNSYDKLKVKSDYKSLDYAINIPEKYLNVDFSFIKYNNPLYQERIDLELEYIIKNDVLHLFQIVYYVLDVFRDNSIIWGVGRGSSCASLLLYSLDLHLVDPILYDIDMEEFFK